MVLVPPVPVGLLVVARAAIPALTPASVQNARIASSVPIPVVRQAIVRIAAAVMIVRRARRATASGPSGLAPMAIVPHVRRVMVIGRSVAVPRAPVVERAGPGAIGSIDRAAVVVRTAVARMEAAPIVVAPVIVMEETGALPSR
ncbi:MAG: hypothetical protein ABMA25_21085 [Ilumatobacteraceae bacterium]